MVDIVCFIVLLDIYQQVLIIWLDKYLVIDNGGYLMMNSLNRSVAGCFPGRCLIEHVFPEGEKCIMP